MVKHIFTVDMEDWFHLNVDGVPDEPEWRRLEPRVEAQTSILLDIFDTYDTKATFFVLGWIADRHKDLITEVYSRGHEIASHGYGHKLLFEMEPKALAEDLDNASAAIESAGVSTPIVGYRAPSYSLTPETSWAWEVLADKGFRYDASVFPFRRHDGGWPGAPSEPYRPLDGCKLWEIPIPLGNLGPFRFVFSAGGYLRLAPKRTMLACLKRMDRSGKSAVFLVHPRDIDPKAPLPTRNLYVLFRQKLHCGSTLEKLNAVLDNYTFITMREAVDELERKG